MFKFVHNIFNIVGLGKGAARCFQDSHNGNGMLRPYIKTNLKWNLNSEASQ